MVIRIDRIGVESADVVQRIYEKSPTYFLNTEHAVAHALAAKENLVDKVPEQKRSPSYEKIFCLITIDGVPAGIVDLHKDHPQRAVTYVGLFLLDETYHKKGVGRLCFYEVENFINRNFSCSHLRLGVSLDNDVEGFWKKLGFQRNGRTYEWNGANRMNQVFEMEKRL